MSTLESRKPWTNDKSDEDADGLRVIGAGLPRTGTMTLKRALEILGFGPCHHMSEVEKKPDGAVPFIRALNGEKIDFRQLMKGYGSTLDSPTTDFYKELHQVYPRAKIILTVRDSGEKWYESYHNTIGVAISSKFNYFAVCWLRAFRLQFKMVNKILEKWSREYGVIGPSTHDLHNRRVISENKESDLLVYNVKEGWGPLCKFLNVDIPQNIPFPNVNDTEQFKRKVLFAKIVGLSGWMATGTFIGLLVYFGSRIK